MSKSSDSLRQEFIAHRDDKSYRHAYADESLNIAIATQIKVLREQREWKQEALAREAQMTQPMISRYENVNYSSWSIKTLKKLAFAYDAWLDVRFRPFGELVITTEGFDRESLEVPTFEDDPFFKEVLPAAVCGKDDGSSKAFEAKGNVIMMGQASEVLKGKPQHAFESPVPPQKVSSTREFELVEA